MKRNLVAVISAVFLGIIVMFMPLFMWHQVNFPEIPPSLCSLRREAMRSTEAYGTPLDVSSISPFYATLILSFLASMVVYVFSKSRV